MQFIWFLDNSFQLQTFSKLFSKKGCLRADDTLKSIENSFYRHQGIYAYDGRAMRLSTKDLKIVFYKKDEKFWNT